MMSKLLFCFVWFELLTRIQSNTYTDLEKIRVCSITFQQGTLNGKFDGYYQQSFPVSSPISFAATTADAKNKFEWESGQGYTFFRDNDDTYGDVYVRLKDQQKQLQLFTQLYQTKDTCSCTGTPVDASSFHWETTVTDQSQGTPGNPQTVKLCGEWTTTATGDQEEEPTFMGEADDWDCDYNTCKDETRTLLTIRYQGFEVFSDDYCQIRKVRTSKGDWRCERCKQNQGYFAFRVGSDFPPAQDGQGQHKCRNCQAVFGDSCQRCDRHQGCSSCTQTAFVDGFQIIPKGDDDCPWQYCGKECCEVDSDVTPVATVCNSKEVKVPAYEHGTTNYICDDAAGRAANSPYYGADKRYTLPLAVTSPAGACSADYANCIGDCNNHLPLLCPGDNAPNCALCNPVQEYNLRGCDICACSEGYDADNPDYEKYFTCNDINDEYFWYSNAAPCAPCSEIYNCNKCQDGGPHGGGGCKEDQCDDLHTRIYDEYVGVYICVPDDDLTGDEIEEQPGIPGEDGWEGLTECPATSTKRAGRHDNAYCGCDCTTCEEQYEPDPPVDEPGDNPWCIRCHFHSGCGQCHNNNEDSSLDYWMQTLEHECENCQERFGERCLFCNDFKGCAQCEEGYEITESCCDGLQYCEYKSRFR